MAELRISSPDPGGLDLRRLALALIESQGWPRDQVGVWQNATGELIITVDEALLARAHGDPLNEPVHTPRTRHHACEMVKLHPAAADSLREVSFADLQQEVTPFLLAGWTPADVLHGLHFSREGVPWPAQAPMEPLPWLRHRLDNWRLADGGIRPSPTQEDASLRVVHRSGLPTGIGLPPEEDPQQRRVARVETVRAAADDARRLMRLHSRTSSEALRNRDRGRTEG